MINARNNKRVWIARNSDGTLDLFSDKPIRKKYAFESDVDKWLCYLDDAFYPEITWENSPKELTIKRNRTNDKQRKASSKRYLSLL